ncbi:phosphotriesterase [Streptomyces sp. SID3343]|uniref:phosphotriesterase family protein n=1 Tax=Streptomyces sp. SID3343 TaxID=2690260 RepID=UPI00136B0BD9|nr:phosphotriesterase [Streptomyces sp. SID3343]MYW05598.1 phosphotriesterase-related protein [Streptomyces sp. SID3343]
MTETLPQPASTTTPVPTVETVLGPVAADALGTTLAHEHVFVRTPDSQTNWVRDWDDEAQVAGAVERLRELRATGVTTIVDPTVDGLGRDLVRLRLVAEQVPDLNIVVATGVYTYTDVPHYFTYRAAALPDGPDPMVDLFVRDIREGIQDTDTKAAFLKCAIDEHGPTPGVERVLRAVARAHLTTGAPIMVHTHPGTRSGAYVHRVLTEEGVDPTRVQLAHSGDSTDTDHLAELADTGYLLGMDRFGLDVILPFAERVAVVAELCRRGYAASMTLSQDAACHFDWADPDLLAALPNWHYLHVLRDVVPALRELGVEERDMTTMLVDNPRRWLTTPSLHHRTGHDGRR